MTDQPTNPLVAGKNGAGRKATVDDLYAVAAELNASAAECGNPYSFAVVPNDNGKMCVRKTYHSHRREARRGVMDRRGEPMSHRETAELNTILESYGATARYREDGSKYTVNKAVVA